MGNVQICHVVELLLCDRLLAKLFAFSNTRRLHGVLVVVVVELVAYTYLLMVVSVGRLTLLVSNYWHTVNAGYATLTVEDWAIV